VKKNFFEYLDFSLQFARPRRRKGNPRQACGIGVGPGKTFNFKDFRDPNLKSARMKDGEKKVDKYLKDGFKNINGWNIDRSSETGSFSMATAETGGSCKRHLRQRCCGSRVPFTEFGQRRRARWLKNNTRSPSPPDSFRRSMRSGR